MPSNRSRGMSFIEILISIVVVGVAMVPLLTMTISTHRQLSSVGRHLVGAQAARSILDRLLQLPYDDCRAEAERLQDLGTVFLRTDPAWQGLSSLGGAGSIDAEAWARVFRDLKYEVRVESAAVPEEAERMFVVRVIVSWSADGAGHGIHRYEIRTIKFKERI